MLPDIEKKGQASPPRNIAIVSSYRAVVPHFETELDIAQQHLDLGDQITFLQCDGGLPNCEFNIGRDESVCDNCRGRRKMGIGLLSRSVNQVQFGHNLPQRKIQLEFDSVAELIDYRIDKFDIGYAALSSLVSFCRDPEPDLRQHQELLKRFLMSALHTYEQSLEFFDKTKFDRVYLFNGRFAGTRSVLRACQKLGIDCYLHERGCDGEHFELLKNHLPHDLKKVEQIIIQRWNDAANTDDRETIGASWYQERFDRVEKVWHSFTKNQKRDQLPPNWDSRKKNISIFQSSDDEFVAIGDAWRNDIYPNQAEAIERIVADLLVRQPETCIHLRMHPNVAGIDNERFRLLRNLNSPNLTVIEPEAEIDTYRMIMDSDIVVSFGSSVGAEAVFWGTPSVLLGPCFYQDLGGVYRSGSHEETIKLLCSNLEPGDRTGVLKYGFWFQTRGYPHQYFRATALFEGTFKGEIIYDRPDPKPKGLKRLRQRISRLLSS